MSHFSWFVNCNVGVQVIDNEQRAEDRCGWDSAMTSDWVSREERHNAIRKTLFTETNYQTNRLSNKSANWESLVVAVLYVSRGIAIMFCVCTLFFFFFFSQALFSEVTERIPFILSHNIRSRCNLIMQPQKFVELYPLQKNHPKDPNMGISKTESDIKWRKTSQRNFTSTIAASVHYTNNYINVRSKADK